MISEPERPKWIRLAKTCHYKPPVIENGVIITVRVCTRSPKIVTNTDVSRDQNFEF